MFEEVLEQVRQRFEFTIIGYVVMPEHVHLLLGEPNRAALSVALQMLKQVTSRKARQLGLLESPPLWEKRYFDFNVWSQRKQVEKLRYMHRNPVERGLVSQPQDWRWSSFRHYALSERGTVEIDSEWGTGGNLGGSRLNKCLSPPPFPFAPLRVRAGHPADLPQTTRTPPPFASLRVGHPV